MGTEIACWPSCRNIEKPFVLGQGMGDQAASQAVVGNHIFTRTKAKPGVATVLYGIPT